MTDCESAARLAIIRTMDAWNVNRITLRLRPSSREEENAFDVPVTDKGDEVQIDPDNARRAQVEVQRMIESVLHIFEETTLECRLEAIV